MLQDRIAVIVLVAVLAALTSGVVGFRVRRNPVAAAAYFVTTGALTVVAIVVTIGLILEISGATIRAPALAV